MAGVAQRAITLVKNDNDVLPLADNPGEHVLVTGWGFSSTQTLANEIAAHGVITQRVYTGGVPSPAVIEAVAAAQQSDVVVVQPTARGATPGSSSSSTGWSVPASR